MALLITTYGAPQQVLPKDRAHFTLQELQAYVGGYLEVVGRLPDGRVVWCNEEGKRLQLPVNPRATQLLQPLLHGDDVLVGDVLVTTLTEAGEDTDLDPSELVEPLDPEA